MIHATSLLLIFGMPCMGIFLISTFTHLFWIYLTNEAIIYRATKMCVKGNLLYIHILYDKTSNRDKGICFFK